MSVGELENRRLVCFASLVPIRQHHLPVMSEGLPWASLPTVARLILVFPLSLASTPTELFIERDPLPPLLGGGGKVQRWRRKAPALMPGYLCVLGVGGSCYGKAEKSQATGLGQMVLFFSG